VLLSEFVVVCDGDAQGDRAEAPNVAVLITDQTSSSSGTVQAVREGRLAQAAGIKIFTISLQNVNVTELSLIASPSLNRQTWYLPSFSSAGLAEIDVILTNVVCLPEIGQLRHDSSFAVIYTAVTTTIRLRFDRRSTAIRPRYDHSTFDDPRRVRAAALPPE